MRILKFLVNGGKLSDDPASNFTNIQPNSTETFIADFRFIGTDWDGAIKVAAFYNTNGECPPQKLIDGMYCEIPKEALETHWFRVQVIGNRNGTTLTTNKIDVLQKGANS